jgi:uncharacterized RDD family membrane protein YckC
MGANTSDRTLADARPDAGETRVVRLQGIGPRLGARVVDTVMIFVLSLVVATIFGLLGEFIGFYARNTQGWAPFLTAASGLVFSIIYYIYLWSKDGQTLGDTLFGNRIVTAEGTPPSLGGAIVRFVGYVISAVALSLGFIWIAIDGKRQGWHDKMARTYVTQADHTFTASEKVELKPSDSGNAPVWIGLWVVLLIVAPGALTAALWTLGPFVEMFVRQMKGG